MTASSDRGWPWPPPGRPRPRLLALPVPRQPRRPAPAGPRRHGLVVRTDRGLIQGKPAEGTDQWLGVPYAAPPVGALRWAAPQPAPRWPGSGQATSYGGRCAQLASGNGPRVDNEDCLYLNVYTPPGADRGTGWGHGLPVLFMIHGGGLTTGAGDQHDGSLIVNTDHIIVVSINYRLGPFGFLTLPGLGTLAADRERQLRAARPGGRAALGAAQHRRVRRRPGPGHHRRRVGGRLVGVRADDLAAGPRAVPRRDHAERQLRHPDPGHRAGRRAWRSPSRRAARIRRPPRPACAPCRSRRCSTPAPATQPLFTSGGPELPVAGRAGGGGRPLQPGAAADRHQPQRGPHVRPGLHRR